MRILLWVGASLLLAGVVAGAAAYFVIDRGGLIGPAERMLGAALGRDVDIGGLDVDFGRVIDIRARDVRVANPAWAEADDAARFAEIALAVRAWPLLRGDVQIPRAEARGGDVNVEIDADGRLNWASAEAAGEVVAPEERGEFPAIAELSVTDTRVRLLDRRRGLRAEAEATAQIAPEQPDIRIELAGTMDGAPLRLDFTGASPARLRSDDAPYPFALRVVHGDTEATLQGSIDDPFAPGDFAVDMTLAGPSLAEILPALKLPLPITPPYRLAGALSREGDVWHFREFDGVVGDSDLAGTVAIDLGGDKPVIAGDLTSRRLDFDDLAGFVGAAPDASGSVTAEQAKRAGAGDGVFPELPLDDQRLHTANLDITLTADKVIAPNLPIEALQGTFKLDDGRLLVRPLTLATPGGGKITGEIALNARQDVPSADADLTLNQVDLRPFFENTAFIQEMGGRFDGRVYLIGVGRSLAEMMAAADGEATLGMRDGHISALLVEAAGVDVAEALLVAVTEDTPLPIRCARADMTVQRGVVRLARAIVDTDDSTLVAQGTADLGAETVDAQVEARAKDFSLLDVAAPVGVKGPWRDPRISIGALDPLPFLEMGDQPDVDCDRLLRDVAARRAAAR